MFNSIFLILITCTVLFVLSEKHKNYGSFAVVITKADICKGPKRKDCTELHMTIRNNVSFDFDVVVSENMSPNKAKIYTISNGNENLRLQLNRPCENLFINPILTNLFNLTSNCVIKKGHYKFTLNYEEMFRAYYGGMHLYGLYTFKSMLYGDQCNFSCTIVEAKFSET